MKQKRKISYVILFAVLCMSLLHPLEVYADTLYEKNPTIEKSFYQQVEEEIKILTKKESFPSFLASQENSYTCKTIKVASERLRLAMKNRESQITLILPYTNDKEQMRQTYRDIYSMAIAHTGISDEGDYLAWHLSSISCNMQSSYDKQQTLYTFQITYASDYEMEQKTTQEIQALETLLPITSDMDTYQIVLTLYDYIANSVSYDYVDSSDEPYTAYGAMVNKKAVCQGYSLLFYRLLLDYGIDNRIIVSKTHAWNLVCVDGQYYECDVTWDSQYTQQGTPYQYLLKSSLNESGDTSHVWSKEELSADIFSYPRSKEDYLYRNTQSAIYDISKTATVNVTSTTMFAEYDCGKLSTKGFYKEKPLVVVWDMCQDTSLGSIFQSLFSPLKEGEDYFVKIVSKGNKTYIKIYGNGKYNGVITIPISNQIPAPALKVTKTKKAVTLNWTAVSSADRYVVYRKKGNGGWKKVITTTKTSYKDTSCKKGTYTYRIRAYYKDNAGSYSSQKKISL